MPDINVPSFDVEKAAADFTKAARDTAYVVVGLGVLGFQRAQVQRVELTKQLETQLAGLSGFTSTLNSQVDTYVDTASKQFSELRDQLVKLGDFRPADAGFDATVVRVQLTELAKAVDEAVAPVRRQFEDQLDRVEEALPEAARELVHSVRGAAAAQEQVVRGAVGLD